SRWENGGLGARLVVVRNEVDRVLLHVGHEGGAEMRHARLRVPHGGGRIAFDRAEVALAVDQPFSHGPWLGHVHEGRINDRFPVWVIVTARVAANFGALTMLPVREKREIVHRKKN